MVAAVPREDQVGGEPAVGATSLVHLGGVQDARRPFDERVRQLRGVAGRVGVLERRRRDDDGFERLERDAEVALSLRYAGSVLVTSADERLSVVGTDHQRATVLDVARSVEGRSRQRRASR